MLVIKVHAKTYCKKLQEMRKPVKGTSFRTNCVIDAETHIYLYLLDKIFRKCSIWSPVLSVQILFFKTSTRLHLRTSIFQNFPVGAMPPYPLEFSKTLSAPLIFRSLPRPCIQIWWKKRHGTAQSNDVDRDNFVHGQQMIMLSDVKLAPGQLFLMVTQWHEFVWTFLTWLAQTYWNHVIVDDSVISLILQKPIFITLTRPDFE